MSRLRLLGVSLLAVALLVPAAVAAVRGAGHEPGGSRRHDVDIRAFGFRPTRIAASPGDSVAWTNHDLVPHTATSKEGAWDSGSIAPGGTWILVVPPGGAGEYLCSFHPLMTGSLAGS